MDKLTMAHDYFMKHVNTDQYRHLDDEVLISWSFDYVDAMQAEADKRNKAEAEQKRKEVREILNDANTFIEREGQHFDDIEEAKREGEYFFKLFCRQNGIDDSESLCEVDWRVAPQDTTGWKMKEDKSYWIDSDGWIIEDAPSFGFTGTHIVERPQ